MESNMVVNSRFEKYEEDKNVKNLIAQANSRYILYNSAEPTSNFPNYSKKLDEKCLHIAFSYLDFGWNFFIKDDKCRGTYCIEKASEIIEHLYAYNQCDKVYKEYYTLICALAYYVSSQYSKSFIVLKFYMCNTYLSRMIYSFLTRNFNDLDDIVTEINFIDYSKCDNSESFVYSKILSIALIKMMKFVYTGEFEFIDQAKRIILDLIELSSINNEPNMWWIFRLLYLIFDEYKESSLWTVFPSVINNEAIMKKYIRTNIYKKTPLFELFKSQRECIEEQNLENSFVVGMPTSSGKTKIAEISIVKTLSEYPDALCIYIAPFRSLANEIENSLSDSLDAMEYVVSNLYGGYQTTIMDTTIIQEANVVIATPEKIKSILRSVPDLEDRIKLIIVDEGHLVGGQPRYITNELLIEELKIILRKTNGSLILLSAVLPNLSDFSKWISGDENNLIKSSWRPSAQRFGELEFKNHTVNLNWLGEPQSFNNRFIEQKLITPARTTKTNRKYKAKYFPDDKKDAVGATAVKMLSMGSVLIYVGRSNMVLSQARVVSKLLKENNITHEWKNKNDLKFVELTCEDAYGEESEFYSYILQGIICHSAKLPSNVRQSVESLMANDNPKIVIATSTLGQGVNIGVSTIIVSNVYLDEKNKIEVKDFWNIAGRAGRAFTDTEGKILYAIDKDKSNYSIREQYSLLQQYFQPSNIEKAESGLLILLRYLFQISKECGIDYETFLELLAENNENVESEKSKKFFEESNGCLELIDDTLISIDIKNNVKGLQDCCCWIDDVFRSSLAYIQAEDNNEICQQQVLDIIKARNKGVVKLAGSQSTWTFHACSSIPLKTSIYIDKYIEKISKYVSKYISSNQSFEDLMSLIKFLDKFTLSLPICFENYELFKLVIQFPIRDSWYSGEPINEINSINKKADKVCNQYYGFHFPWIINAISKKLAILEKEEESKVLENISLFSEIGVPNIISAQIYLAGIKSRQCAIELSKFFKNEKEDINLVKIQLLFLLKKVNDGEVECSEKSKMWLELISNSNNKEKIIKLKFISIQLKNHIENYDELFVKSFDDNLFLCSWDYKVKIKINDEKSNQFECLIGKRGVFFKKKHDMWELKSENPYIIIKP